MNNKTYRWCFVVCEEVRVSRIGKRIRQQDYPAAIVSCADSWNSIAHSSIGQSGKVNVASYQDTPRLRSILSSLGTIGGLRANCKNRIGACAEPHAARLVMKANSQVAVRDLVFSYAYRPRTKTVIRYCRNCTDVLVFRIRETRALLFKLYR